MNNLGVYFHHIAKKFADNDALIYEDNTAVSYGQLDELSNQIANFLLDRGVRKNHVVAILNTKTVEGFALMLACLKIGAVYCNLDANNPSQRLAKMLQTCQPILTISDHIVPPELKNLLGQLGLEFINHLRLSFVPVSDTLSTAMPELNALVDDSDAAYLMFTSGSTGFPKAAIITHGNVSRFFEWSISFLEVQPQDRVSNVNPIFFDNSVFDVFTALFSGATLLPVEPHVLRDPNKTIDFLTRASCTIWFSVPSLLIYLNTLKLLTPDCLKKLRHVLFGGEGFPKSELKKVWDIYKARAQFTSVYGPTECTCICSYYRVSESDFSLDTQLLPLGTMLDCFSFKVLDENGKPVGPGHIGELYLIGSNVGKGYYNNPGAEQRSFVPILCTKTIDKSYRTGDLVKNINDALHFCGRIDNQIKHMGYRIELEEIENALHSLNETIQAAVIYKTVSTRGGKILAFVTAKNASPNQLKMALRTLLPDYMIPSKIILLDALPKNANGKVDKQALQAFA